MKRYFVLPDFPREWYERLRAERSRFRLREQFTIPKETGKGVVVQRGHTVRFVIIEGPQIADVNVFNAQDPAEHLRAMETLNREGFWLTRFSRLWSNMPRFRPLMTIIEDTVRTKPGQGEPHHHHIFGGHCNPYEIPGGSVILTVTTTWYRQFDRLDWELNGYTIISTCFRRRPKMNRVFSIQ